MFISYVNLSISLLDKKIFLTSGYLRTILFAGLSFNLPGFKAGDAIQMQCKSSFGQKKSNWQHDRSKDDVKWPPHKVCNMVMLLNFFATLTKNLRRKIQS